MKEDKVMLDELITIEKQMNGGWVAIKKWRKRFGGFGRGWHVERQASGASPMEAFMNLEGEVKREGVKRDA